MRRSCPCPSLQFPSHPSRDGPSTPLVNNEPDALPTSSLVPPGQPNEAEAPIATHIPTLSTENIPMPPQLCDVPKPPVPPPVTAGPLSAAEWSVLIAKAQAGDLPNGVSTHNPVQVQPPLATPSLPPYSKIFTADSTTFSLDPEPGALPDCLVQMASVASSFHCLC